MNESEIDERVLGVPARFAPLSKNLAWTARDRLVAVGVLLALLVMVTVPLTRLDRDTPSRFGWQMFSSSHSMPVFNVVPEVGEPWTVDLSEYVAVARADLFLQDVLPAHLCDRIDDAAQIETVYQGQTVALACAE